MLVSRRGCLLSTISLAGSNGRATDCNDTYQQITYKKNQLSARLWVISGLERIDLEERNQLHRSCVQNQLQRILYIRYSVCSMPVLNCLSQHHSLLVACFVTATYALALSCALLCLSITLLLLSHVPCFVSASRCSCFLMCLALSQHHAALAFSCALLCLSITLLLLSHVPCFVSASRCTAYHAALILMCLASSQYCFLKCFDLSQHP